VSPTLPHPAARVQHQGSRTAPLALLAKAEAGSAVSLSNLIVALHGPAFYLWKRLVPLRLSRYKRPPYLHLS